MLSFILQAVGLLTVVVGAFFVSAAFGVVATGALLVFVGLAAEGES